MSARCRRIAQATVSVFLGLLMLTSVFLLPGSDSVGGPLGHQALPTAQSPAQKETSADTHISSGPGSLASPAISRTPTVFPPRSPESVYPSGAAPIGIADYGRTAGGTTYYYTSSFIGTVSINSLLTYSNASGVGYDLSFQLNVILRFEGGNTWYVYWIQDVAFVNTSSHAVYLIESAIWNFSSQSATMYASTVSGNGEVYSYEGTAYYGYGVGDSSGFLFYPGTFQLIVNSTSNSLSQPVVQFMYNDGGGFVPYDVVTFDFVRNLDYSPVFIVDGQTSTPYGLPYDAELVMCGPGSATTTTDESSDLQFFLQYWNGGNYETVNDAFDYGSDTAESISGADARAYYYLDDGQLFSNVAQGSETQSVLWYSADISIFQVDGPDPFSSAILRVGPGTIPYLNGEAAIAVEAGTYSFSVEANGVLEYLGTLSLAAGTEMTINAGTWYQAQFVEEGLPSGTDWGIFVDGTTLQSRSYIQSVYLPDGEYSYSITPIAGYSTQYNGQVTVNNGPASVIVTFALVGYSVTFKESGLLLGTTWSVTLDGAIESSTSSSATFSEPNGTYSYSIGGVPGWHETDLPYTGSLTVSGAAVTETTLAFSQVTYTMTISESTLPSGLTWIVTVNGVQLSRTTDGSLDTLTWAGLANGTYSYSIADNPGWHQTTLPYGGSLTVNGGTNSIGGSGIGYANTLVYGQVTYSVTFSESGQPSGLTWGVTFNGLPLSLTTNGGTDTLLFAFEPNGTYPYSIAGSPGYHQSAIPYAGSETVDGASFPGSLTYALVTYTMTIGESTLPSGLTWIVTVNGVQQSRTTDGSLDTLTWAGLANGTYSYSIADNPGWHQTTLPYGGSLTVNGGTNSIGGSGIGYANTLVYGQVTYSVTFSETGLPSGTSWSITLNGVAKDSTTGTSSFSEPNGTYAYTVGTVAEYASSPSSGTVMVTGVGVNQAILFTEAYPVTFTETGLLSGMSWSVTLNGVAEGSMSGTVSFTLANGVYWYSIGNIPGWHETDLPYTGSLTVSGAAVTETTLAFSQVTYTMTISESTLPSGLTWIVTVNGVQLSRTTDGSLDTLTWAGLANGTYSYSIADNPGWHQTTLPYGGSLTVNGGTNSIGGSGIGYANTLVYGQVTYSVTFSETGLPSGTSWSITLNGVAKDSTTGTSSFSEPNGTCAYTIADVPGWHQTTLSYSGSITVNGASVTAPTLAFTRATYSVTFTETGLPSGTSWSMSLNGVLQSSTTGTSAFAELNGTYAYTVTDVPGWHRDDAVLHGIGDGEWSRGLRPAPRVHPGEVRGNVYGDGDAVHGRRRRHTR